MRLDRGQGAPPLYAQLANMLEQQIAINELHVGEMIPTEQALGATHGLSRGTVIKALSSLVDRGLLVKRQGRGTFVTARPLDRPLEGLDSFSRHVRSLGMRPGQQLISFGPLAEARELSGHFPPGTDLIELVRVRTVDGEPVGLQHSVVPAAIASELALSDEVVRQPDFGLYDLFSASPYALVHASESLRAVNASRNTSLRLGIEEGTALIEVERVSRDAQDRTVEAVRARYVGSWYVYRVELDATGAHRSPTQ